MGVPRDQSSDPSEARRRKLWWESAVGFLLFFTVLAGVQAVWNAFRPDPSVGPAVVFAVLLLASALVWRVYRRH